MKGDKERCLASGMDGYVSKPVRPNDLLAAMAPFFQENAPRRVLSTSKSHTASVTPTAKVPEADIPDDARIDWKIARATVLEDEDLLARLSTPSSPSGPAGLRVVGGDYPQPICEL